MKALEEIAAKQPEALAMIERNGFVFERENIGNEPGNWSHLAFTLYTVICEIDSIARAALAEEIFQSHEEGARFRAPRANSSHRRERR